MPKYVLDITTLQRLVIEVPPGTDPFHVKEGFAEFRGDDNTLAFAVPVQHVQRCERMPEESPIVKPQ